MSLTYQFTFTYYSLTLADPGTSVELILTGSSYCGRQVGRYRPIKNGNLAYFYTDTPYDNCIGGSFVVNNEWQPNDNENVFINEKVCDVNNSCKFNYGKLHHQVESSITPVRYETYHSL